MLPTVITNADTQTKAFIPVTQFEPTGLKKNTTTEVKLFNVFLFQKSVKGPHTALSLPHPMLYLCLLGTYKLFIFVHFCTCTIVNFQTLKKKQAMPPSDQKHRNLLVLRARNKRLNINPVPWRDNDPAKGRKEQ